MVGRNIRYENNRFLKQRDLLFRVKDKTPGELDTRPLLVVTIGLSERFHSNGCRCSVESP